MTRSVSTLIKFAIFGLVMAVLTAFLFLVFSDTRTGPANEYSCLLYTSDAADDVAGV